MLFVVVGVGNIRASCGQGCAKSEGTQREEVIQTPSQEGKQSHMYTHKDGYISSNQQTGKHSKTKKYM